MGCAGGGGVAAIEMAGNGNKREGGGDEFSGCNRIW